MFYPREVPQVEFAACEIRAAAQVKKNFAGGEKCARHSDRFKFAGQSGVILFSKTTNETYTTYLVTGAMYGRLDIAGL